MRVTLFLFITTLALTLPSHADAQTDRTAFRNAYEEYQLAIAEDRLTSAKEHAKVAYQLGRPLYGDAHKNTAALALNYGRLLRGDAARKILSDSLRFHENAYPKDAPELLDPLLELAAANANDRFFVSSLKHYRRSTNIIKKHAPENKILLAKVLTEMGAVFLAKQNLPKQ